MACELARSDGWVLLSRAAQVIHERAPEALDNLKARYGHGNLKALLMASGMFEISEEATPRGMRVLYRQRNARKETEAVSST